MFRPFIAAIALFCVSSVALSAAAAAETKKESKGVVYHVVSVKLKDTATPEQIKAVEEAFAGLKSKIAEVQTLHWGTNVSPEKHDKGFTHCFVLTFASEKDRNAYLVHPEHAAFGKILGPVMADVMVLDFVAKE